MERSHAVSGQKSNSVYAIFYFLDVVCACALSEVIDVTSWFKTLGGALRRLR